MRTDSRTFLCDEGLGGSLLKNNILCKLTAYLVFIFASVLKLEGICQKKNLKI